MLIFGIVLSFVFFMGGLLLILFSSDVKKKFLFLIGALIFYIGSYMFGALIMYQSTLFGFHSKNVTLKTEVRQEYLNGQEISVDTVYIFTPKKK